ncbi:MAG: class I SAM-dependent methyltransferase family protein [Candidatus Aenigmarchaeota archaeon]|nr:class I SAM-dependent methyltransferase family protein [Candidatus Aenigmarchaeota archaeon]
MKLLTKFKKVFGEGEELIPSSFDVVGSREKAVAIVEFPENLKLKKLEVAKALLRKHKNVKSVLEKVSERKGRLRLRKYTLIAGNPNTEVLHKEYGYVLKLDPQKVYFSPREAYERQRIATQVKAKESVLVMFSGIAPYCIAIAKSQPLAKIYGIEINRDAHEYALENVRINRVLDRVSLFHGDVRKVLPKLKLKFDRIVMPLPKGAYRYLDIAIPALKKDGILHFYYWGKENKLFDQAKKMIEKKALKFGRKVEIISYKEVLPYAPKKWKIVLDVKII